MDQIWFRSSIPYRPALVTSLLAVVTAERVQCVMNVGLQLPYPAGDSVISVHVTR